MYNFEAYPVRGGNHAHAMELTQGFLRCGHTVSVVDDSTMPGVTSFGSTTADLKQFLTEINVLYIRIDARYVRHWAALKKCMSLNGSCPIIWEINSPANETLAYSWLGGKTSSNINEKEGVLRRARRAFHALRKLPGIIFEERYRCRLAAGVSAAICVSSALGRYADERLGIKDVLVLPNGGPLISEVEISQRRERRQRQGFTVLYTGSAMYPWQGLDYLSGAIALAEVRSPDVTFILAVNQRTPVLPESSNVIILERLNREEILDAICAADACVALHPEYFWSKWKFHGSPMKLFEYMGCMSPVVTSRLGQMLEIINDGDDGVLCENDPNDILDKLLFLRDDPKRAKDIGRKGWERIQSEFSWQHNVEKTLNVFERLLARSSN